MLKIEQRKNAGAASPLRISPYGRTPQASKAAHKKSGHSPLPAWPQRCPTTRCYSSGPCSGSSRIVRACPKLKGPADWFLSSCGRSSGVATLAVSVGAKAKRGFPPQDCLKCKHDFMPTAWRQPPILPRSPSFQSFSQRLLNSTSFSLSLSKV